MEKKENDHAESASIRTFQDPTKQTARAKELVVINGPVFPRKELDLLGVVGTHLRCCSFGFVEGFAFLGGLSTSLQGESLNGQPPQPKLVGRTSISETHWKGHGGKTKCPDSNPSLVTPRKKGAEIGRILRSIR